MSFLFLILLNMFVDQSFGLHEQQKSDQLIVVTTQSWNTIEGRMSTYEWRNNKWKLVISNVSVVTGRNGLAWGKGLHDSSLHRGKLKKEGDGNSPAGIFRLTGLFGYQTIKGKMDALKVNERTFCVDDSKSPFYNQIVSTDTINKVWNSAETMRMKSDVYKYGIFVDYNVKPAVPGEGSCIFMHIWRKSTAPTAGCTAMTEADLLKLIGFLDKSKNPVLVQVPLSEYNQLKSRYKLP